MHDKFNWLERRIPLALQGSDFDNECARKHLFVEFRYLIHAKRALCFIGF